MTSIVSRLMITPVSRHATRRAPVQLSFTRGQQSAAVKQQPVQQKERKPRAATESKSVAFNLFRGQIVTDQVFPYPDTMTPDQKEMLQMMVGPTEKFFSERNDAAWNDENEAIPPEVMEGLKEVGAFGLLVAEEYGGSGLNNTQYARLGEILGTWDLGLSITLGAHQSIGYKGIMLEGTPAQKAKYLPDCASGEKMAAFCLTEPSSGSDAASIRTKAVLSPDGSHYIMNGGKIWISNGGIAEILTVFAQTPMEDPKTGEIKDKVTAFIVERGFGGVSSGPPEKKMGIKASNTTEIFFADTKIPVENVLGQPGEGFKVAMNILNNGRFGMGAALAGTMRKAIEIAVDFAAQRNQFGSKIHTYGAIQEKIARMSVAQYVTESIAYVVAANMDRGIKDFQIEAAVSKIFGSESAWFVVDEAIQVLGGNGFMKGPGLERRLRDLRIFRIFEGTNDILRLFAALTGIQYAGGHLRELQKAMSNPASNLGLLIGAGSKRAKRMVGLSTGDASTLTKVVHPELQEQARLTFRATEAFGGAVEDLLVEYGKGIINQQYLLNRLADALIDTYAMICVLSRCSRSLERGDHSAEIEKRMTELFCSQASDRIQLNLTGIKSKIQRRNFDLMKNISDEIIEVRGVVQTNPVGF